MDWDANAQRVMFSIILHVIGINCMSMQSFDDVCL